MIDQTLYQGIILFLLMVGLVPALVFVGQHRPRQWRRMVAWDASGWVIIAALWFLRSIVLILTRWPGSPPKGWGDAVFAVGMLVVIDALLIIRIISFRSFAQRDAERVADGSDDVII